MSNTFRLVWISFFLCFQGLRKQRHNDKLLSVMGFPERKKTLLKVDELSLGLFEPSKVIISIFKLIEIDLRSTTV